MQYDDLYEGVEHFKAMTLSEARKVSEGEITHILRKKSTTYRGRLVLVSKEGETECFADLVEVRNVKGGYLWEFSNVEKMIPFPARKCGIKGEIWDLFYTEDTLITYPKNARAFMKI